MRRGIWTAVTVVGVAMLCAAVGLALFNLRTDMAAAQSRDSVLQALLATMPEESDDAVSGTVNPDDVESDAAQPSEMATIDIDGNAYIGTIFFPTLNLELPVLAVYDLPSLRIAPAVYYGTPAGGDLVICAHNYYSHFGRLNQLAAEDEVLLKTVDDVTYHYQVSTTEIVSPNAVADVTSGEWDLTLFTCTLSGQTRVVVRCDLT